MRLSQTRDFKADFEVLGAVHGRRVSIGELIARLVSINGLTQMDSVMSTITGRRFLEMLTTVHSRWDVEIEGRPREPIMLRPEVILRHVHEMFRLRNIYAHELVVFDEPDRAAIGEALESSVAFLKAAAEVVGNLLHPDAPLTQADMNRRSLRDLEALDAEIATILEKLSALVGEKRRDLLHASQQARLEFRRRQAEFEASIYREGTIYPVIFGTAAQALAKVRLTDRSLSSTRRKAARTIEAFQAPEAHTAPPLPSRAR